MDNLFNNINLEDTVEIAVDVSAEEATAAASVLEKTGVNPLEKPAPPAAKTAEAKKKEEEDTSDSLEVDINQEEADKIKDNLAKLEGKEKKDQNEEKISPVKKTAKGKDAPQDSKIPDGAFTIIAQALKEEGFLTDLPEDFDGSPESFINVMGNEIKLGINEYVTGLPTVVQELIAHYEEGVPLKELIEIKSDQISLEGITADSLKADENLQKDLIYEDFRLRGLSEKQIKLQIDALETTGNLLSAASDAHTNLIDYQKRQADSLVQKTKQEKQQAEQNRIAMLNKVKQTVEATKEIVPGIPLSNLQKDQLYKSMTTVVAHDDSGRPLDIVGYKRAQDPLKFDQRLHYLASIGVFDDDYSKLTNLGKKKSIADLEKLIKPKDQFNGGKTLIEKEGGSRGIVDSLRALDLDI